MTISTVLRCTWRSSRTYEHLPSSYCINLLSGARSPRSSIPSTNVRNIVTTSSYLQCQEKNTTDVLKSTNKSQRTAIWTIPNMLCGLRITLSPLLGYYIIDHSYILAIGALTVAGLTDLADGYIARNFRGQSSRLGTFLDPLADKILITTLYSSMVYADLTPVLLTGVIVFRDILLLSAGMYIRYFSIPPPRTVRKYFDASSSLAELRPTYLSKVNTVLQIAVAVISLYAPTTTWITRDTLSIVWYVAGFSTVASGLSYMFSKNTYIILQNSTGGSR